MKKILIGNKMIKDTIQKFSTKNNQVITKLKKYLQDKSFIILIIVLVALTAYGFELFNLNLTIDEENASIQSTANTWRLESGRWGGYLLNKLLFPLQVIPFVPLFVALLFQIVSILLMLDVFGIEEKLDQIIVGIIGISYPGMVFIYNFSTANYAAGFGLFCVVLCLFIYVKNSGIKKLWSVIPAVLAVSIYEPFIPALVSVFLLYEIYLWDRENITHWQTIKIGTIIILLSVFLNYILQKILLFVYGVSQSGYTSSYFNISYLLENWRWIFEKLRRQLINVYAGDLTIYGIEIRMIVILLFLFGLSILFNIMLSKKYKSMSKIIMLVFLSIFLSLPFLGGVLTKGYVPLRTLVGLPLILSGWALLGLKNRLLVYKTVVFIVELMCVFQFISSSNHLFASSHLALEQDKILGSQLMLRIEDEKANKGIKEVNYLEMIGYVNRPSTPLISRIETIGASFFGWDQGNSTRAVRFLSILGYDGLQPLPNETRYEYIPVADEMPVWPAVGSVQVVDDVVLVKFGSYSKTQIESICSSACRSLIRTGFCP